MTMNGRSVPLADVEDRDRVRLAGEPRRRQRLAREPLPQRLVPRVPLGEHLDRDGSPERLVLGAEDLAHAAEADRVSGRGSGAEGCRSEGSSGLEPIP